MRLTWAFVTFLNARSTAPGSSSASCCSAISRKRLNWAGSSGFGFGLRGMNRLIPRFPDPREVDRYTIAQHLAVAEFTLQPHRRRRALWSVGLPLWTHPARLLSRENASEQTCVVEIAVYAEGHIWPSTTGIELEIEIWMIHGTRLHLSQLSGASVAASFLWITVRPIERANRVCYPTFECLPPRHRHRL